MSLDLLAVVIVVVVVSAVVTMYLYREREETRRFQALSPDEQQRVVDEKRRAFDAQIEKERLGRLPDCPGCGRRDALEPSGPMAFRQSVPPDMFSIQAVKKGLFVQGWRCANCGTRLGLWRVADDLTWRIR